MRPYYNEDDGQVCPSGTIPWSWHDFRFEVGKEHCFTRQVAMLLLWVWLLFSAVVLVNLLVAMMSDRWADVANESMVVYKRRHYYWVRYHERNPAAPELVVKFIRRVCELLLNLAYLPCTLMAAGSNKGGRGGKVAAVSSSGGGGGSGGGLGGSSGGSTASGSKRLSRKQKSEWLAFSKRRSE